MGLKDILLAASSVLAVLLTVIQVSPIKIDPWSAFAKCIGKAINADVLQKLEAMEAEQKETRQRLDTHIEIDDERNADEHRRRILQFSNELLRSIPHKQEEFIEILSEIDFYEDYCDDHPKYENNRAVHAIAHIKKIYDERLDKHDFS